MRRFVFQRVLPIIGVVLTSTIFICCSQDNIDKKIDTTVFKVEYNYNNKYSDFFNVAGQNVEIEALPGDDYKMTVTANPVDVSEIYAGKTGVMTTCVLNPGQMDDSFDINLVQNNSQHEFKGTSGNQVLTFSYSGKVNGNILHLDISGLRLKNSYNWENLHKFLTKQELQSSSPIDSTNYLVKYEGSQPAALTGVPLSTDDFFQLLINAVTLPKEYFEGSKFQSSSADEPVGSISNAITNYMRHINFSESSNLQFSYIGSSTYFGTTNKWNEILVPSLLPYSFQYVPESENVCKVYINVGNFININNHVATFPENSMSPIIMYQLRKVPSIQKTMIDLVEQLDPLQISGVTLSAQRNVDNTVLTLDTESSKRVLKVLLSVYNRQSCRTALADYVRTIPELSAYTIQIENAIDSLPEIIDSASALNISCMLADYELKAKDEN